MYLCVVCMLLLSSPEFPEVKLELLTLENVTITATRLSWPRGDDGVETTSSKLGLDHVINLGILLFGVKVTLSVVRELDRLSSRVSRSRNGLLATLGHRLTIVRFVPLTEGCRIDLNNSAFHEGVCSDKFVV